MGRPSARLPLFIVKDQYGRMIDGAQMFTDDLGGTGKLVIGHCAVWGEVNMQSSRVGGRRIPQALHVGDGSRKIGGKRPTEDTDARSIFGLHEMSLKRPGIPLGPGVARDARDHVVLASPPPFSCETTTA